MKKGIAVIIGTFNPVHKAHINLGKQVLRKFDNIQNVIYVPVGNKYEKSDLLNAEYRFSILEKVCQNIDKFDVSRVEIDNEKQLFTYQTLDILKKEYADSDIYLVIGSDNLKEFHTWKEYKYILQNYNLIVFSRNSDDIDEIVKSSKHLKKYANSISFIRSNKYLNISSTQIRNNIRNGEDFRNLVPKEAYEYIIKNNRYMKEKEKRVC